MIEKKVVKNGREFSVPWSVKEGSELLEKIKKYLLENGFFDVDDIECGEPGWPSYANIFYNPENYVRVRMGWQTGVDPSDWRDSVYEQGKSENVFSYVEVTVKSFDAVHVDSYASQLEKLLSD